MTLVLHDTEPWEEALRLFQAALRSNPLLDQYWLSYFIALMRQNKFQETQLLIASAKGRSIPQTLLDQMVKILDLALSKLNPPQDQLEPLIKAHNANNCVDNESIADDLSQEYPLSLVGHNITGASAGSDGD